MSTSELKTYVDARTPEERRWLRRYLWEKERGEDSEILADLDRRIDELNAGINTVTWSEAASRLNQLDGSSA